MLLNENKLISHQQNVDVYVISEKGAPQAKSMEISEKLRDAIPRLRVLMNCDAGSFKSQFKRADKSGASVALIIGEQEIQTNTIGLKSLREDIPQESKTLEQVINFLSNIIR
jgi:histidyl-tRNA synthetase